MRAPKTPPRQPTRSRPGDFVPILLIVAVTMVAFAPVLSADFVTWDDDRNFTGNPSFRGLAWPQLKWMWTTTLMGHYIPLSWMTLGLDYTIWGMDARGYHLTNLILHAGAAVAVYVAARTLILMVRPDAGDRRSQIVATATALLFAIHPLRVESVAWVTERRDMLSLVLMLASLIAYLRFAEAGSRRMWIASLILFGAALLAKASVVTLPLVLLILEWYPLRRLSRQNVLQPDGKRVLANLAPFFILSGAAGILSLAVLHPPAQLSLAGKAAVSAYGVRFYLTKWLWPVGLSPLRELPRPVVPAAPTFVAAYVFSAVILFAAWKASRSSRAIAAILAATAVMMLPLIGVVQNGPQIVADRYTYHAAAALSLLPALLLFRVRPRIAAVIIGCGTVLLGGLTWRQSGFWRNSEAMWGRVLAIDSSSSLAQTGMANVRITQQRFPEALDHYQRAVALDPDYAEGRNNLASLLARSGRFAEAIPHYERATQLQPRYPEAFLNWGVALSMLGRQEEAVQQFGKALAIDSMVPGVHLAWGNALLRAGRRADAVAQYREELRVDPGNARARINWGVVLAQDGQYAEAIAQFDEALRIDPALKDAAAYRAQAISRLKR